MKKTVALAALAVSLIPVAVLAAPKTKMVSMYKAAKCGMYFTPKQAKEYHYACPDSHGKMSKVKVTPAVAKAEEAKTMKMLAPAASKGKM